MQKIADHLGISKMTVSNYLKNSDTNKVSEELKQKIDQTIIELNYAPPITTRFRRDQERTGLIAVLIPIDQPFFRYRVINEMVSGLQHTLFSYGYSLTFVPVTMQDHHPVIDREVILHCKSFDGVVIFGTRYSNKERMKESINYLITYKIPSLVLNMPDLHMPINQVVLCNNAFDQILETFIQQGHKRIILFTGTKEAVATTQLVDRFKKLYALHNLPLEERQIIYSHYEKQRSYTEACNLIASGFHFSAILTLSSQPMLGVYQALQEYNLRIPDDVSICSYEENSFAECMTPPLTTVQQPAFEAGKQGAELLRKSIEESESEPTTSYLKERIIMRKSIAKLHS